MIKEYHTKTGKRIRLIHGDCMEWMKDCERYDLAIVDPPYGIDWMKQIQNPNTSANWKHHDIKAWDKSIPQKEYWGFLFSTSANQIVWGGNYMIEYLKPSPCWLIRDKMQEFTGAVFEMAWTSFNSPAKAFRMSRVEAYANKNKIHATEKPVKLYRWLLQNYAQCKYCHGLGSYAEDVAGDGGSCMRLTCEECDGRGGANILDTHGGSMSHAIACWEEDFELDIIELDRDYYDSAVKRFETHISQKTLF